MDEEDRCRRGEKDGGGGSEVKKRSDGGDGDGSK